MSNKIGEFSEGHLLNVAKSVVEKKTKDSLILDTEAEQRIPKFETKGEKLHVQKRVSRRQSYAALFGILVSKS